MRSLTTSVAAALCWAAMAGPAGAQSAYEINRLNQAIQVCNSPAGAAMPECAKLRGQFGGAPAVPAGGAAAGLAGLLGQALGARGAAPPPPSPDTAALQRSIASCVQDAAGDHDAIQACLAMASRPATAAPFALGIPARPVPAAHGDTATSIHRAGQSYQACAAASPNDWRSCLPLLNGGAPR